MPHHELFFVGVATVALAPIDAGARRAERCALCGHPSATVGRVAVRPATAPDQPVRPSHQHDVCGPCGRLARRLLALLDGCVPTPTSVTAPAQLAPVETDAGGAR